MGKIIAICTSPQKGMRKKDQKEGLLLRDFGLEGDAHASGTWHRQVSLLAQESIDQMVAKGLKVGPGDFAENLTTTGIELYTLPIGTRMRLGDEAIGEVTQIGKVCHNHCAIYEQAGDCVMPREGIFIRVLRGGRITNGDEITLDNEIITVGILIASDKGAKGEREDLSGPEAQKLIETVGGVVLDYEIVPDERDILSQKLIEMADEKKLDVILTSGGTGFSPRDITPEATSDVIERATPGLSEVMRAASLQKTDRAMLSRGVAGIRGKTLIVNLPGSPKSVRENLQVILPALPHGIKILRDFEHECGAR